MKKIYKYLSIIFPTVALIASSPNLFSAWSSLTEYHSFVWVFGLFVVTVLFGVVLDTLVRNLLDLKDEFSRHLVIRRIQKEQTVKKIINDQSPSWLDVPTGFMVKHPFVHFFIVIPLCCVVGTLVGMLLVKTVLN